MTEKLIPIASYATTLEAELARDRLAACGIDSYLDGANCSAIWQLDGRLGSVKLLIAEPDEKDALAVLEESQAESGTASELEGPLEDQTLPTEQALESEAAGGDVLTARPGVPSGRGLPLVVGVCFLISPIIVGLALKVSGGSLVVCAVVTTIVYLLIIAYYTYNQSLADPEEEDEPVDDPPDASDFT